MSKLGSLYIRLGEPEGDMGGCCETADWAADEIERLRKENAQLAALLQEAIEEQGYEEYSAAQARAEYECGYYIMDWVARTIEAITKARGEA